MSRYLESADEVPGEIATRSDADAAAWFADWLRRRDAINTEMAVERVAEALETLAAELRGEAHSEITTRTRGLILAAAVLFDTAGGLRVGDVLTPE